MPFLDITVMPVPTASKAAYLEHSRQSTPLFKEQGAISVTEAWGDDVPDGEVTDFKRAVNLKAGETVAVGWITWPDRATRDKAWEALMQDGRMMAMEMPFDGKRMIFAGFELVQES
ncbi:DUF1428 domain-containing protein [Maricaulis sp.]|uniref:DUF1428 domain-containing protein n=1 Tax=Maricaulis sp. TaxID=1486257 RepID=UPI003A8FF9DC|tara:strand:- start:2734 stop:3081 length:348 start_codon:yes stop_codon:yes gene_type:complete